MKKNNMLAIMLFVLLAVPVNAMAEVNFTMDISPVSFLISTDVDGFQVENGYMSETIEGTTSFMPNIKAGIGIDTGKLMHLDITGGVGYVFNGAFSTTMVCLDVAPRFKLGNIVTLAPHIGLIKFGDLSWGDGMDATYADSDDVKITDGGSGLIYGVALTVGKKVAFIASIDGINVEEYKVTTHNGYSANQETLDISGYAVQLGVKFRF